MSEDTTQVEAEELDELDEPETEPYESEGARRLRIRETNKAEAKVVMAAEAKKALRARDKRIKGAAEIEGQAEFREAAAEVERRLNEDAKAKEED